MNNCALITGASSGIGEALAHSLATRGYNILLVARREDKLKEVHTAIRSYGREVEYIVADITNATQRETLYKTVSSHHELTFLVNNAGFGLHGYFDELDNASQLDMIVLNITALVDLTHKFLPLLMANADSKKSYILNVGSVAGFQPGPFMAVYYATKSFVLNFTEALAEEMRIQNTNVVVSVVCPGPTKSEFGIRAGFKPKDAKGNASLLMKNFHSNKSHIPSARDVAEYAVKKILTSHTTVIIHTMLFKILYLCNKVLPRKIVTRITGKIQMARKERS